MRTDGQRESENVEDRRDESGSRGGGGFPGGGGLKFPFPGGGQGGGGLIGVLLIIGLALLFGIDPRVLLEGGGQLPGGGRQIEAPSSRAPRTVTAEEESLKRFVSVVLSYTEDVWTAQFRAQGKTYVPPKLTLYRDGIDSGCGFGQAQMGPFYCPNDRKIYIDLGFYEDLKRRFAAPGDFAQAYVIAHEVGHHIQTLLGVTQKAQLAQRSVGTSQRNAIQVQVELQADCLAGVWAKVSDRVSKILEPGDIEEALRAASQIGDDKMQEKSGRGRVSPDSFTHGSSEQRVRWFKRGFESGSMASCDTFSSNSL